MRPDLFTATIPFDEALRRVTTAATPIERIVTVSVYEASGRVAARDVTSSIDVPSFDRSAMDGYAIRAADVASASPDTPVDLTCVARVFTGEIARRPVDAGTCAAIATGAPLPAGADAVVMVERTTRRGDVVSVREATRVGQNVGRRGADITHGQVVLHAGDLVTAARAGSVAAIGGTSVDVFDRPVVAILSTGAEVAPPGAALGPGQIYDTNTVTLSAVARDHGAQAVVLAAVEDSVDALVQALESAAASNVDVIVTSGGSSVGERDLLIDAISRCGTVDFHGIAVKPGKPTLFGLVGRTPIFGMPGNPTSCLSNALILLVPFLRGLARLPPWQPRQRTLPLARPIKGLDRHQFYSVRIVGDVVEPAFKSSGDITSMADADGYIEIPAGSRGLQAGETVTVSLLRGPN